MTVLATIEMTTVPGSQHLWGIEVAMYFLLFASPLFAAGGLGRWVKRDAIVEVAKHQCSYGRYDLTGNERGVCPECREAKEAAA